MKIVLAGREHESSLRELARNTPVPGWIELAYCREPDFFHGLAVEGSPAQVCAAIDGNAVVGMGCRSIRGVYVNGRAARIGYLGSLRIAPSARGAALLGRAYRFIRQLHERDRLASAYLTTIVEGNHRAMRLLTSGRAGLPRYIDYGRFVTYAVASPRSHRPRDAGMNLTFERGSETDLPSVVAFLNREGPRKQFFPALSADEFGAERLRGLRPHDFLVAREDGEIVGVLAGWDQSSFKQYLVHGYAPALRVVRPVLNLASRVAGCGSLPPVGECLSVRVASFACVRDNDPRLLAALLDRLCRARSAARRPFVLIGFHERDPLSKALDEFRAFRYTSRMYLVCWEDGVEFAEGIDAAAIPHLELATL